MRVSAACLLVLAAFAAWAGAASAQPRQLPALAPAANDGLKRALTQGRLTEAQYALERARSLFRLGAVRREFGDVERPSGRDATLILRDLALRLRELSGTDRREAERLLARPDDGDVPPDTGTGWTADEAGLSPLCGDGDGDAEDDVCVHWVDAAADPDAPPSVDNNMNGFPDQVDDTLTELLAIWDKEIVDLGYRAPLSDAGLDNDGGGRELDVYLDDLGFDPDFVLFGYCTVDPDVPRFDFAVPVYCVVDNDYQAAQYGSPPGNPPDPDGFLKVTLAHEFFHAVQGAYDFGEDWWFMEGTAANMEETVYPTIDDNVNFLSYSPLTRPGSPLDRGGFGDSEYGSWIFWRFLEEKLYRNNPNVIRRVWNRAAWALGPDEYSLQAVARVLRNDGIHLAAAFAGFGVANRLRTYADGNLYPRTPTGRTFRIGPAQRRTAWQARRMNHLTTRYISFRPRRGVPRRARLGLNVDAHPRGGRARVIVYSKGGNRSVRAIRLNRNGDGHRRVPFGRKVRRVDLVLSNGSSRMRCWRDGNPPFYSCFGVPKDDRRTYRFRAILRT